MLYYIFRFLEQYDIPGSHIWAYISFRSLLALIMSLMISAWFGEYFIKWMKRRNISETARDPSIDPFGEQKKGVPTMGGIIIIVSILVPVILLGRMRNIYLLLMIVTTVWLGFLGFMDDYIKIFRKNKEGLKGIYKIIGQVSIGFIVGLTLWLSPDAVVRENISEAQQNQEIVVKHKQEAVKSLQTTIPFIKNHNLNYSNVMSFLGKYKVAAGWILFVIILFTFVIYLLDPSLDLVDSLWFVMSTLTTVGYGDVTPNTLVAKASSLILLILGVFIFSTLTGAISSYFTDKVINIDSDVEENVVILHEKIDRIDNELEAVKNELAASREENMRLHEKIDELLKR